MTLVCFRSTGSPAAVGRVSAPGFIHATTTAAAAAADAASGHDAGGWGMM